MNTIDTTFSASTLRELEKTRDGWRRIRKTREDKRRLEKTRLD